jgi:hypothetical protein
VLSKHNDLREVDSAQPALYQQYHEIIDLEIRVDGTLQPGYETESGITTVTGSALIYTGIIPNISDYFVTDAGDDHQGMFRITNVERRTFNQKTAWTIEYTLVGYSDVTAELYTALKTRVIRTYHFSKDRLLEQCQPLLTTDQHHTTLDLQRIAADITTQYYRTYFNRGYMTLVLPGQSHAIYDSYLARYMKKITAVTAAPEVMLVRDITTDQDRYLAQTQFWDVLYRRAWEDVSRCNQNMGLVSKHVFLYSAFIHGLAFSNIEYIVYPITGTDENIISTTPSPKPEAMQTIEPNRYSVQYYTDEMRSVPLIPQIMPGTPYVMTASFYDGTPGMSVIEILTKDYIRHQSLDLPMLSALCAQYRTWGPLEQYYYGPVLITLANAARKGVY